MLSLSLVTWIKRVDVCADSIFIFELIFLFFLPIFEVHLLINIYFFFFILRRLLVWLRPTHPTPGIEPGGRIEMCDESCPRRSPTLINFTCSYFREMNAADNLLLYFTFFCPRVPLWQLMLICPVWMYFSCFFLSFFFERLLEWNIYS